MFVILLVWPLFRRWYFSHLALKSQYTMVRPKVDIVKIFRPNNLSSFYSLAHLIIPILSHVSQFKFEGAKHSWELLEECTQTTDLESPASTIGGAMCKELIELGGVLSTRTNDSWNLSWTPSVSWNIPNNTYVYYICFKIYILYLFKHTWMLISCLELV